MAHIIDGKKIAGSIRELLKKEVQALKEKGCSPGLATLLVGSNAASQIYVRNKHRACEEVGIASFDHHLSENASEAEVLKKVEELNQDNKVHAILVQLPLPSHLDSHKVLEAIDPHKDADGFHPYNLGRLLSAKDKSELKRSDSFIPLPCTPHGIMVLLESTNVPIAGKQAVVIGRSVIVGKPVAALLMASNATVTVAHSQTKNLVECCSGADILVAAIGRSKMVVPSMVKPGAVVIDVGINRDSAGKIWGDVDFESVQEKAGWITPVPGGVGPMTIVMLLKNTVELARYFRG